MKNRFKNFIAALGAWLVKRAYPLSTVSITTPQSIRAAAEAESQKILSEEANPHEEAARVGAASGANFREAMRSGDTLPRRSGFVPLQHITFPEHIHIDAQGITISTEAGRAERIEFSEIARMGHMREQWAINDRINNRTLRLETQIDRLWQALAGITTTRGAARLVQAIRSPETEQAALGRIQLDTEYVAPVYAEDVRHNRRGSPPQLPEGLHEVMREMMRRETNEPVTGIPLDLIIDSESVMTRDNAMHSDDTSTIVRRQPTVDRPGAPAVGPAGQPLSAEQFRGVLEAIERRGAQTTETPAQPNTSRTAESGDRNIEPEI